MTRVRSPAALVASLACLSSAAVLAGVLVSHEPTLASAAEGDSLEVEGELAPWAEPDGWDKVHERLWATTYRLAVPGVDDVVLLTGMEPGLEHQAVVARAIVLLELPHPDLDVQVIVLAPQDEPGFLR